MAANPHDPMQMLSAMFDAGQELMRRMTGGKEGAAASAADPFAPFTEAAKQFADMQRQWLDAATAAAAQARQPGQAPAASQAAANNPLQPLLAAAQQIGEMQKRMLEGFTAWRSDAGGGGPAAADDKRFAGEAWSKDPRYAAVSSAYLAYADFLHKGVDAMPVDGRAKSQMRFGVRQMIDAMSPSNFFLTNPEAAQLALETGGRSITEGMALFMRDAAKGRVLMTDEEAFAVGTNLATTPGTVVFQNHLIQLIQYTPTTPEVFGRPLVIVPPCVNKFYILDLQRENSFVRHAVARGHTVFLASWRNADESMGRLTWNDYVRDGVLEAIDVARAIAGVQTVNALGFCVGGTLLACALSVLAANNEDKVESLTLLTTLLDFEEAGELGLLVTEEAVAAREAAIGQGGLLQGKEMAFVFSSLRANDLVWQYVVAGYLKGKAPPAFDLLFWNSDSTNLPGPMVCWLLRHGYLENRLGDPGKVEVCGVPLDFGDITMPAFVYASREDHIVPWQTAFAACRLLGGDTTFVLGASGHIAGVINPPEKKKRNFWVDGNSVEDADAWLATARSVPGSWWPEWAEWLEQFGGEPIPAPAQPGNEQYKPIEPAPGNYVLAKA